MEFNLQDFDYKNIAYGLLVWAIATSLTWLYRRYRVSSIKSDIEMLTYEKEHLEEMKRFGIEMNRSSFRGIFAILIMFSIAGGIPHFVRFVESGGAAFYALLSLFVWAGAGGLSYKYFRRINDLKSMKSAIARIDSRIEKLNSKL